MKKIISKHGGFTLVEMMIAFGIFTIVALVGYLLMSSSSVLLAENLSLNHGNTTVRGALDRISSELNQGVQMNSVQGSQTTTIPGVLLNSDSSAYAGNGSAPGILFDRYVGGTYVVNDGGTTIASGASSFKLSASQTSLTSPPAPKANDVVVLQSDTSIRSLVSSVSSTTSSGKNVYTVTLSPAFGTALSWDSGMYETAYLIHREAVVVVPVGSGYEMRFYPNAESLTSSNYNNTSSYVVLTSDIGKNSGDSTPFSVVQNNGANFVNIAMRVEDQLYTNYLATRQANQFNTFARIDTLMRPRNTL